MSAAQDFRSELRLDGLPIQNVLEGLAQLHQLVFVADRTGRVVWMSDQLGAICGRRGALVGHDMKELIPRSEHLLSLANRARRGEVIACEPVSLDRDGRAPLHVEVSAFTIDDAHGERLLIAIVRPSDERETSARANDNGFLASLLDNAPGVVIATDGAGFVSYANAGAQSVLGFPCDEMVGKPVGLFMSGHPGLARLLAELQANGAHFGTHEVEIEDAGGNTVWYEVTTKALRLADSSKAGTVSYLRDITHRKDLDKELERKRDEVENYLHRVSHDLRSPLVSVLGFARLLRQDYERLLDEAGLHFLDRIEQGGQTMDALIESLLSLSRIGRVEDHPAAIDPRSVMLQLAAELKPRLEELGIELVFPKEGPLVHCDKARLYQAMSALVTNALDHMGPASLATVAVSWQRDGDWVQLCVADNGCGIDEADHERIFEVFQTLGTRGKRPRSTGIGLALARKIVSLYGGRIWVESAPDKGARFRLTLPSA